MGVGIALDASSCWLPAGWVGRAAADYLIPELDGPSANTVRTRLETMYLYPGAIAFFEDATAEELVVLERAARRASERQRSVGVADWDDQDDQSGFEAFRGAFDELVEYIAADPRINHASRSITEYLSGRTFRLVFFHKG